MKKLGQLIKKSPLVQKPKQVAIDEKSAFFIFESLMRQEYGRQGAAQVRAHFFKEKRLFVHAASSNWANEIWLNKDYLTRKMNQEIGWEEIKEIVISQ